MAKTKRKPVRKSTTIAQVTEYAWELMAQERAARVDENPQDNGVPAWLLLLAMALLLATLVIAFVVGPVSYTFLGALAATGSLFVVLMVVRTRRIGALPPERMAELGELDEKIRTVFEEAGVKCYGCPAAYGETLEEGSKIHPFDVDALLAKLNDLGLDMNKVTPPEPEKKAAAQ